MTKKDHPINPDRRYEVDEIVSDSTKRPSTVIPDAYWQDFIQLCSHFEQLPAQPHLEVPF